MVVAMLLVRVIDRHATHHGRVLLVLSCLVAMSASSEPNGGAFSATGSGSDGVFRSVDVYVGAERLARVRNGTNEPTGYRQDRDKRGTWHGQNGQDRTIARLFEHRRGGYFVDLASNEPLHFSNSRTLERDLGWRGVCVDGSMELVVKTLRQRTCRAVQAIVTGRSGEHVSFTVPTSSSQSATGFGGIAESSSSGVGGVGGGGGDGGGRPAEGAIMVHQTSQGHRDSSWRVESHTTVTLDDILERVRAPSTIDYLSLDVEGAEEVRTHMPALGFPMRCLRLFLDLSLTKPMHAQKRCCELHDEC